MIHLKSFYNMASGSSLAITVTTLRSHFSHDWLTLLHWIHSGYKYFRYLHNGTLSKNSFTLLKFFVRENVWKTNDNLGWCWSFKQKVDQCQLSPTFHRQQQLHTVGNGSLRSVVNYLKIYFWGEKNNEVDILLTKKIFELYFESTPQNWPGSIQEPVFHWVLRHSGRHLIRLPAPQSSILLSHCTRGWENTQKCDFATKFNVTFRFKCSCFSSFV